MISSLFSRNLKIIDKFEEDPKKRFWQIFDQENSCFSLDTLLQFMFGDYFHAPLLLALGKR